MSLDELDFFSSRIAQDPLHFPPEDSSFALCYAGDDRDRNVLDLGMHVWEAWSAAKEHNWPSAAERSTEVAKDILDLSQNIGRDFLNPRENAVRDGYAGNSDLGFQ